MQCELQFGKGANTYKLYLENVSSFFNYTFNISGPFTLSIENGENDLALLIFEKDNTDAIFSVSFECGSFRERDNNENKICEF